MNFYVPIIIVSILVFIALLLVIADKVFGLGGEKVITINEETKITVRGGITLRNALAQHKIFLPSACGGKTTCGYCKFRLIDDSGAIMPTEEPFLSDEEKRNGTHLSCQFRVRENIKIEIPNEYLNAQEFKTEVEIMKDLTCNAKLVRLKLIDPETMNFKPGQYAELKVPGIEVIRAYSIASNPKEANHIEFIVRLEPKAKSTGFVKSLKMGDKVTVIGPFGHFYLKEDSEKDIICIASGSGKAPICSILYYLKDTGMKRKVKFFYDAISKADLYYNDEFIELSKQYPNFKYIPSLSAPLPEDEWKGEVGLITDVVDKKTDDLIETEAYICGSPILISTCIDVLNDHKIQKENIFYDQHL